MLSVSAVTKSFAGRVLFENASIQVNRGDRIGLVGPNGAGKTTLFSLILGNDEPDLGSVSLQRGSTLGFLRRRARPPATRRFSTSRPAAPRRSVRWIPRTPTPT